MPSAGNAMSAWLRPRNASVRQVLAPPVHEAVWQSALVEQAWPFVLHVLPVGGPEHDDRDADIRAILGRDALQERALLLLGARRGVAAELPVAESGADHPLRGGRRGGRQEAGAKRGGGRQAGAGGAE